MDESTGYSPKHSRRPFAGRYSYGVFDELAEHLDINGTNVTQVSIGPSHGSAMLVDFNNCYLWHQRQFPDTVTSTTPSGYLGFTLPIRWQGDFTYMGELTRPGMFFRFSGREGYMHRARDRESLTVVFKRKPIIDALAALSGRDPYDVTFGDGGLVVNKAALDRTTTRLVDLMRSIGEHPKLLQDICFVHNAAAMVTSTLLDLYLSAVPDLESAPKRLLHPHSIVKAAEERFMATPDRPVSLADLCVAAGVGATTLNTAFNMVCNESPLRYFKLRRLSDARSRLVLSNSERSAVKRAALSSGLTELGRFSVEYRQLFGETPSETLSRSSSRSMQNVSDAA